MSQVQKSVEINEDIGESMDWLLEEELENEKMIEVVAELENQDFEPLKPFEEDNDILSKFYYNDRNPELYEAVGHFGFLPGMMAAAAIEQGTIFVDPQVGASTYGMFAGGLIGAYIGKEVGRKFGEKVNETKSDDKDFREADLGSSFEQDVYNFIASSDFIESAEASAKVGSYGGEILEPVDAAKAYRDVVEELEEERKIWEDQLFLEDYKKLTEEAQAIVDTYTKEELKESPLADKLKEQAEISKTHQKMIEKHEQILKETEINTFLKYNSFKRNIESEETQNFTYDGFAYEIEIYQGEDLVLTIDGVNSEKPITELIN